jgi:DNA polymerase III alpha subunit
MKSKQHNYAVHNKDENKFVISANSHAVAYTYISSRLLYLKAHWPLEFFAATLKLENEDSKIKDYKIEAEKEGIKVNKVDINKSNWNFEIVDNEIYMGFSNIKGIGEEISKRIVEGQPYESLEDFLNRFGTDAKILKPLIALRMFGEEKLCEMYEFYEYFKKEKKKREDRNKRTENTLKKHRQEFLNIVGKDYNDENVKLIFDNWIKKFDIENRRKFVNNIEPEYENNREELWKLYRKYVNCINNVKNKMREENDIKFENFNPTGNIDIGFKKVLTDVSQVAEQMFFGFCWKHIMEDSPDYTGLKFDQFEDDQIAVACVEVQIVKPIEEKVSKKGNNYYTILVEDSSNEQNYVNVWEGEYKRFKEELSFWDSARKGNLLKLRLERPSPGFKSYRMESFPKHLKHKIPEDKNNDYRLSVMKLPDSMLNREDTNSLKSADVIIVK